MSLSPVELATKIKLHPFANLRVGQFSSREKSAEGGAKFPALIPHYAAQGCPRVNWNGDQAVREAQGAQIEVHFALSTSCYPGGPGCIPYSSVKKGELVQLTYGRQGVPPTSGAYRTLREAGATVERIMASRQEVYMVSYAAQSPGQYGAVSGRFHLLGIFSLTGETLWLNPEAVRDGLIEAEYPVSQRERSVAEDPHAPTQAAAPAPVTDDWFNRLSKTLAPYVDTKSLRDAVLKARANELVEKGAAPSPEAALAMATADATKAGKAPSAPEAAQKKAPSSAKAAGKSLLKTKK